jgi:multidrug resistance protein, MATE family
VIQPALIRAELPPMLRLAIPVVLAELGWMAMGVVDTIMVGPLGPEAIAATGVGTSLHMAFAIFGMGLLLGLDTLVSQAFGARQIDQCHRWLVHGAALALLLSTPLMLICWAMYVALPSLGFHPAVEPLLVNYYRVIIWSSPFLLLYAAFRRYLQGTHIVKPIMFALVSANVVNAGANWMLIFGHFGFPAMGVTGAAWATLASRVYMVAVLFTAIVISDRWRWSDVPTLFGRLERAWFKRLLRLGFPAASTVALEVGVFASATALAGKLDPISAASHQIALNIAALSFMVPLGLASAGAVRVGHAVGAADPPRAAAAGWTAILLGIVFTVAAAIAFVVLPRTLIGFFTDDEAVLALGSWLLFLAAVFQLFDGLQGVATGVLRGVGDTRTPMITNLTAHWLFGLPVGYTLCFVLGVGVFGLWIGLSTGLIIAGVVLLYVWHRRIRSLQHRVERRQDDGVPGRVLERVPVRDPDWHLDR